MELDSEPQDLVKIRLLPVSHGTRVEFRESLLFRF